MGEGRKNLNIAYYIRTDIQHLPPVLAIYVHLGGIVFTKNPDIYEYAKKNHPDIKIKFVKKGRDARRYCRSHDIRVVIYTGYQMIWHGYSVMIFHGISDKRYEEDRRIFWFDLLLLNGQKQWDKINGFKRIKKPERFVMTGYPKLDRLYADSVPVKKRFNNNNKTVLYAPTWISNESGIKMAFSEHGESSLPLWGKKIVTAVAKMKNVNLIIKYHSRINKNATKIYDEIEALIAELNVSDRIKTVWESDIIPCMKAADVMISDISAVCYEWFHFNKPILFANPAPDYYKPSDNPNDSTSAWKVGYVINREDEIMPLLKKALDSDEKKEIRNQLFEYSFYKPDGKAGQRQVEEIKKLYERVNSYSKSRVALHNWLKLIGIH